MTKIVLVRRDWKLTTKNQLLVKNCSNHILSQSSIDSHRNRRDNSYAKLVEKAYLKHHCQNQQHSAMTTQNDEKTARKLQQTEIDKAQADLDRLRQLHELDEPEMNSLPTDDEILAIKMHRRQMLKANQHLASDKNQIIKRIQRDRRIEAKKRANGEERLRHISPSAVSTVDFPQNGRFLTPRNDNKPRRIEKPINVPSYDNHIAVPTAKNYHKIVKAAEKGERYHSPRRSSGEIQRRRERQRVGDSNTISQKCVIS